MYICHVHSKKLCDKIYQCKNKVYYLFLKKKSCSQFYPVKPISVFIDFKHGDFFSITSLFKTALFLQLLLIWRVNEPAADRNREKPRKVV